MLRQSIGRIPLLVVAVLTAGVAGAAEVHVSVRARWNPRAANVVVPQSRSFRVERGGSPVRVTGVRVGVVVVEQVATTTMDISVSNPMSSAQQAELLVPVPEGVALRGFTFQGSGAEPSAELLGREEARRIYDSIVARMRDPALLEFAGLNLVRTSVFPVPAGGTQKLRLTYEQVLVADGARVDYFLPRSESLDYRVPWEISVRVKSRRAISTVYSPSHLVETRRPSPREISARLGPGAGTEPGAFRLSYVLEAGEVSASLMAYPDPRAGGGYFLLLAGLPARPRAAADAPGIRREVTLVLDRSGSMNGEKLEQVREAALQVVAGLEDGERFNVIAYNEGVDPLWSRPQAKSAANVAAARRFLKGVTARGGTNIHDALLEALRPAPAGGALPLVLFLTDGRPTVGQTSEKAIRELAAKHNRHQRRIFTFGVGLDVNTPLLEKLAHETRATGTFVLPGEDVEVAVAGVYRRLAGPVLASPVLEVVDAAGRPAPGRTRELVPARVPDMFEGDQLVLLGRYTGEEPLNFRLRGDYLGRKRTFRFSFKLAGASARHAYVPRLWASRKIAVLTEAIRSLGADLDLNPGAVNDPRIKELVDEIVRLSTEFGIMTEYTSFLAREGTDLSRRDEVLAEARRNFVERAMKVRGGAGSFNQEINNDFQMGQYRLNKRNRYLDRNLRQVEVSNVQQMNDLTFYQRGGQWVDARVAPGGNRPDRVVKLGSEEHRRLVDLLVSQGRQGAASLRGEVLMRVDGETVMVQ
jgi:Ca-activated chloride channel family protein